MNFLKKAQKVNDQKVILPFWSVYMIFVLALAHAQSGSLYLIYLFLGIISVEENNYEGSQFKSFFPKNRKHIKIITHTLMLVAAFIAIKELMDSDTSLKRHIVQWLHPG